jgi:hypothetical protein
MAESVNGFGFEIKLCPNQTKQAESIYCSEFLFCQTSSYKNESI